MKRALAVLKMVGTGSAGALWILVALFERHIQNEPVLKTLLYMFGILTVIFSLVALMFEAGWLKRQKADE